MPLFVPVYVPGYRDCDDERVHSDQTAHATQADSVMRQLLAEDEAEKRALLAKKAPKKVPKRAFVQPKQRRHAGDENCDDGMAGATLLHAHSMGGHGSALSCTKKDAAPLPHQSDAQQPAFDERECIICLDNLRCMVLCPCGHTILCEACCTAVQEKNNLVSVLLRVASLSPVLL